MTGANPGLDLAALQGLRGRRRDTSVIGRRIRQHLDQHEGYVAFSGGKDSLVALDLARRVDPQVPVVFFHSGLEFPETVTYIDQLAERWQLNLHTIPATIPGLDLLAASGGWDHHAPDQTTPALFDVLIAEPARRAHDLFGPGELWGVRAGESHGRAAAYHNALASSVCSCTPRCADLRQQHGGRIARKDGTVAYGPVWDWTTDQIWGHIHTHQLPVNPVYATLQRLGAPPWAQRVSTLIDGGRLENGRLVWLQRGWPGLYAEVALLLPRLREFT